MANFEVFRLGISSSISLLFLRSERIYIITYLASCCYFYWKIIWFSYDCKLELFLMNESEDDQLDVGTLDPLNQVNVVEDLNKKDVIIRNCNVDQTLLNAITLVDRKLTRLTLVAAIGNKHIKFFRSAKC